MQRSKALCASLRTLGYVEGCRDTLGVPLVRFIAYPRAAPSRPGTGPRPCLRRIPAAGDRARVSSVRRAGLLDPDLRNPRVVTVATPSGPLLWSGVRIGVAEFAR